MSRRDEISIREAIRQMLERYHLSEKVYEVRLVAAWEDVVGPVIARHTLHLAVRKKILFVKVDSAALRNELTYAKTLLINQLNKEAGAEVITDIIFR